jgi:hypothetical protein
VRIEVVDPGGHGVGVAIGLCELGHDVAYVGAHQSRASGTQSACMKAELIEHMFGSQRSRPASPDLLLIVDVFADYLQAFQDGIGDLGEEAVHHPLQDNAGVYVYPERLAYYCKRAQAAERVAVIDTSDHRGLREIVFEAMPHVSLFAREVVATDDGPWTPFPFLYNLSMLWLEYMRPLEEWFVAEGRNFTWDWAFCGTVDHERYHSHRTTSLRSIAQRWPRLRGTVITQQSFLSVIKALQSSRVGLDLPGIGELCFRLHECLALGTSIWRPWEPSVALPEGLQSVVVAEPGQAVVVDPQFVRSEYLAHYAPRAAAKWLIDALELPSESEIASASHLGTEIGSR